MRNRRLVPYRERVISGAEGRVLEIGIGSGLNLPFYPRQVRDILGLEPAPRLIAMAQRIADCSSFPVTLIEGTAESIPLDAKVIDTVVTTWTLCSIPQADRALSEMRRVRKWQDGLTPAWKRIGGGCHLNRPMRDLIESNGFAISRLETGYMRGPKPMTFMYEGSARLH
jgi:SAM-dependent methyltransferase